MMPTYKALWPDKWLKAHHLQAKKPTVTIENVQIEELYNPRARRNEPRLVVSFYKKQLRMVLNKTQATALANITGTDDYQMWIGHQVVLSEGTAPNNMPTIVISPTPDPPPETPAVNGQQPEAEESAQLPDQDDDTESREIDPVTPGDFDDPFDE